MKPTYEELLDGLRTARAIIRGQQIEHALFDMERPNLGLGAYLDTLLFAADEGAKK